MKLIKRFIPFVLIVVLSLPAAVAVTLLTLPVWRWFEATTGIEAYGHSGPAEWCYLLVYGLIVTVLSVIWYLGGKNKHQA